MIQGRFVKGAEVVEIITNGMQEIRPELEAFTFTPRETHQHIDTLDWSEILRLAVASGGTVAALLIAILSLRDIPFAQMFFIAIAILDGIMILRHLRKEEV